MKNMVLIILMICMYSVVFSVPNQGSIKHKPNGVCVGEKSTVSWKKSVPDGTESWKVISGTITVSSVKPGQPVSTFNIDITKEEYKLTWTEKGSFTILVKITYQCGDVTSEESKNFDIDVYGEIKIVGPKYLCVGETGTYTASMCTGSFPANQPSWKTTGGVTTPSTPLGKKTIKIRWNTLSTKLGDKLVTVSVGSISATKKVSVGNPDITMFNQKVLIHGCSQLNGIIRDMSDAKIDWSSTGGSLESMTADTREVIWNAGTAIGKYNYTAAWASLTSCSVDEKYEVVKPASLLFKSKVEINGGNGPGGKGRTITQDVSPNTKKSGWPKLYGVKLFFILRDNNKDTLNNPGGNSPSDRALGAKLYLLEEFTKVTELNSDMISYEDAVKNTTPPGKEVKSGKPSDKIFFTIDGREPDEKKDYGKLKKNDILLDLKQNYIINILDCKDAVHKSLSLIGNKITVTKAKLEIILSADIQLNKKEK